MGTIHNIETFKNFDKFEVKTIKLDDFDFSNKISIIKIDVEGHELKVIDGAKETIKKHKEPQKTKGATDVQTGTKWEKSEKF